MNWKLEVMPSEKIHPDNIKKFDKVKDKCFVDFTKSPLILIQGAVGSGKSSLLYSIVKNSLSYWDVIIYYCSTKDSHQAVKDLLDSSKDLTYVIADDYKEDEFSSVYKKLNDQSEKKQKNKDRPLSVLIVVDDMGSSKFLGHSGKTGKFFKMIQDRRHLNTSMIVCQQNYSNNSKSLRENNLSQFIITRVNKSELEKISKEHACHLTEDDFTELYKSVKAKNRYNHLLIDYMDLDKPFKVITKDKILELDL